MEGDSHIILKLCFKHWIIPRAVKYGSLIMEQQKYIYTVSCNRTPLNQGPDIKPCMYSEGCYRYQPNGYRHLTQLH